MGERGGTRERLARRKGVVGKWEIEHRGLVKRKDAVQKVSQSGPERLWAEKDVPRK